MASARAVLVPQILIFSFLFVANIGYSANPLVCSADQTSCDYISSDLYNGDRVVIFNENEEVVASGVVKSSEGRKRKISIQKRFVKIRETDSVELNEGEGGSIAKLKSYKHLSQKVIGADLLLASYNFGSGITGIGIDGFGISRTRFGFDYVGRAFYQHLSGNVTSTYNNSTNSSMSFGGNTIGTTVGLGFNILPREVFSIRGDVGLGVSYLTYSLTGDLGSNTLPVSAGLGWCASGFLGGVWHAGSGRHYQVGIAPGLLQNAFYAALSFGMSFDYLK